MNNSSSFSRRDPLLVIGLFTLFLFLIWRCTIPPEKLEVKVDMPSIERKF